MSRLLPSFTRRIARPSIHSISRRAYATNPFGRGPSPPRLPSEEQAEFERLQRSANTQEPLDPVSNLPLRKGAPPEFEGEVNPKTGEVGGPKNEPLRWGHSGDWSYNGRVTDF
ncbi:hypothetical protein BKA67DRAFT_633072 [Truncatella angustata]|uniref:Succinate dehydrogenase assembly factor 4, mitochondrial n=1 Tax=Truncatella angustata TaxID=152316 RepID=A0A9P8RI12_9PEZI|nr:uncharacterized protein BKA67DRAFT_633072 [Truncatella angustata]KAH6639946.1 hypothetical protein BKA67DRAFT_633072 [Truncatella angustata]